MKAFGWRRLRKSIFFALICACGALGILGCGGGGGSDDDPTSTFLLQESFADFLNWTTCGASIPVISGTIGNPPPGVNPANGEAITILTFDRTAGLVIAADIAVDTGGNAWIGMKMTNACDGIMALAAGIFIDDTQVHFHLNGAEVLAQAQALGTFQYAVRILDTKTVEYLIDNVVVHTQAAIADASNNLPVTIGGVGTGATGYDNLFVAIPN